MTDSAQRVDLPMTVEAIVTSPTLAGLWYSAVDRREEGVDGQVTRASHGIGGVAQLRRNRAWRGDSHARDQRRNSCGVRRSHRGALRIAVRCGSIEDFSRATTN